MWRDPHGRIVGPGEPLYVIAEAGLNHGGSVDRALALVDAAAGAGASAVKIQSLSAPELVAPQCPPPAHVATASLQSFFARFELDADAHAAIVARARRHALTVISTPLSETLLPMLERAGVDAYKVASGDLTNDRLLMAIARTRKPVLLSTGMAAMPEIVRAVRLVRSAGGTVAAVLHCVSAYPVPVASQNLRALVTLARHLDAPVGLSDHAADASTSAVMAVALGALVYERHLMLEGDVAAVDAAVSSTPAGLKALVRLCAEASLRLGTGLKVCQPAEAVNRVASRRGVYVRTALPAGHVLQAGDLVALRPETSVPAAELPELPGQTLTRALEAGEPLTRADLGRRAA